MKKYFVVSDVHGFYDELMTTLKEKGFDKKNPDHVFVSCGDLLDRGNKPIDCLKFVNSLPKKRKILIRGNHEDLLQECLTREDFKNYDISNGTTDTVLWLAAGNFASQNQTVGENFETAKTNPDYQKYMKSLIDYAEIGDYIFVHGWIPCLNTGTRYNGEPRYDYKKDWRSGDWSEARWVNGMLAWYDNVRVPDKTIVCGHWHTSFGHSKYHNDGVEFPNRRSTSPEHRYANFDPFIDDGIIALDACTAFSHKVNCVVLEI